MAAAKLVPSAPWPRPGGNTATINEIAIGNIMTVVAVLLIHMLIAAVASITPPSKPIGLAPTRRMM
jgi:hypothetical protein